MAEALVAIKAHAPKSASRCILSSHHTLLVYHLGIADELQQHLRPLHCHLSTLSATPRLRLAASPRIAQQKSTRTHRFIAYSALPGCSFACRSCSLPLSLTTPHACATQVPYKSFWLKYDQALLSKPHDLVTILRAIQSNSSEMDRRRKALASYRADLVRRAAQPRW